MAEYASVNEVYADFLSKVRVRPRRPIVGLIGYARSGKDTVAARLSGSHGFKRFAFADKLKSVAMDMDPVLSAREDGTPIRLSDHVYAVGWERAKETAEVRRMLQEFGQAMRVHVDYNVWVTPVIRAILAHHGPAVVTDVRYPNEANEIRRVGGMLVRVVRPGVGPVNRHASETALDGFGVDWSIQNNGTLEALALSVDAWHRLALMS